ncbi:hypothetical protein D3873_03455 [Paenisporosarcina cavernae]|uniref:Uncharacterized protein n=1 Tax=Paenisporosarcina cavernae TaxID=2320858 RepID=A0A385YU17_9BACL|nr:hypothetical protein D3873_03455 [Paenisporosarcina cavernae]
MRAGREGAAGLFLWVRMVDFYYIQRINIINFLVWTKIRFLWEKTVTLWEISIALWEIFLFYGKFRSIYGKFKCS